MKTAIARSAGGVVFGPDDQIVLLATASPSGKVRWSLPKGALEDNETNDQAALREVREETGLDAQILEPVGVIEYWFVWKPDEIRYHKYVHYFAMRMTGGDFSRRDQEADDVAWFSTGDAISTCSYANEREIIRKAVASLCA